MLIQQVSYFVLQALGFLAIFVVVIQKISYFVHKSFGFLAIFVVLVSVQACIVNVSVLCFLVWNIGNVTGLLSTFIC